MRPRRISSVLLAAALGGCSLAAPSTAPGPTRTPTIPTSPPVLGLGWATATVERPPDAFAIPTDPATGPEDPGTAGHPGHFPGQATVTDVSAVGDGFVAVGFVGWEWRPVAWRAADPTTWTMTEIGRAAADEAAFAVAVTGAPGDLAIAVGRAGRAPAVWRSDDGGAAWTHVIPPVLSGAGDWERMTAVAVASDGTLVAGGSMGPELLERTARFWRSDDGTTWEPIADVESTAGAEVTAIVPLSDGGWLALGRIGDGTTTTDALVWRSADGRTWSAVRDPAFEGAWLRDVVHRADGTLVAVGSDAGEDEALAWISSDGGATWDRTPGEPSRQLADGKIRMMAVVEVADELVAVGNLNPLQYGQGMGWTSTDGLAWVRSPNQPSLGQAELLSAIPVPPGILGSGAGAIAVGSTGAPDNYIPRIWLSPPA